ncbi:MAG: hypothetical protein ACFFFH_03815 [Candidatus Thorarchaeota archaeon]
MFIQHGDNYFRHKVGHHLCVLSSLTGGGRTKEKDMRDFLTVHNTLQNLFERYSYVEKLSNFHWKSSNTEIYLLPQYYPERRLITINKKTSEKNEKLLLLVPDSIETEKLNNAIHYGNLLYKVRAIHRYVYDHSIPKRLVLTNGEQFFHLTKPRPWWSKKRKEYCKTVFKYNFKIELFNSLL